MKKWAVIGAGPAGIAAVGNLLDLKQDVLWIDPHFEVGDFGRKWNAVPGNTRVELFTKFLTSCESFNMKNCPEFQMNEFDLSQPCVLGHMGEALKWVTNQLVNQCEIHRGTVQGIMSMNGHWDIYTDTDIHVQNIVLATGGESKELRYGGGVPLEHVLNMNACKDHFDPNDRVAVFGSSHTAVLAVKHLVEFGVTRIINFYQSPLRFALMMGERILYDDTGLKGTTAEWAKLNLVNKMPSTVERVFSNEENINSLLPTCNKVVYGIGFDPRKIPVNGQTDYIHDPYTGIIAPGLFGCGMAFPETYQTPFGHTEQRVGLWKFMTFLKKIMPIWTRYSC